MKLSVAVILCLVAVCRVNAFFEPFDIFKQFQPYGLHEQLTRDVEPLAEDEDVDFTEPEQVEVLPPGFSQHGFPEGLFNFFGQVPHRGPARVPWWKGEHVCVDREEIDESQRRRNDTSVEGTSEEKQDGGFVGSFEMSSCQQTDTRYTCTTKIRSQGISKTLVVKHQCCHGYRRQRGQPGCKPVVLKSLEETITELGAKDFVQLIKSSNLEDKLSSENLTLFIPNDDTLRDFMDRLQRENQVEFYLPPSSARRRRRSEPGTSMRDIALAHITASLIDVEQLENEQVLPSELPGSMLRVNIYPGVSSKPVITCNCAKLTLVDNYASNGVVHIVDRVITPVTKTLAELVEQDDQFTTLLAMLTKAGKLDVLKKQSGHVTLFAPTDAAFKKLPAATLQRLQEGQSCLQKVLSHHLLSHTLCSAAIVDKVSTYNSAGDVLHLERRSSDGKLFIEGVQIVTKDVMATNGIIHVIDEVMVPDSAKPISEVLSQSNLTTFVKLLTEAGLTESLDAMDNITVLAPTDEALANAKLSGLRGDVDKLRSALMYHVITTEVPSCDLANNQLLNTTSDHRVRINLYASQPLFMGVRNRATAQCARVVAVDKRACSGVIHAVDRLMVPPTLSVMELLQQDEQFSSLRDIIKGTELEAELRGEGPITFLAPTNLAFDNVEPSDLQRLVEDKKFATRVLKQHTLPETLCCAGVMTTAWPFTNRVETLAGDSIVARRDHHNTVHIGTTTVDECDLMANNGLVHAVNRVMLPRSQKAGGFQTHLLQRLANPNVDVVFYGL